MDAIHRRILIKSRVKLVRQILEPSLVADLLRKKQIFNEFSLQTVNAQPTQLQQSAKLLDILATRGPCAFVAFLDILKAQYPLLHHHIRYLHNR
jgi:hypothetical protein